VKVRLGTKLLFAQLPLGAALLVVGALAVVTIETLGSGSQEILKDNYRSVLAMQKMRDAVDEVEAAVVMPLVANRDMDASVQQKSVAAKAHFEAQLKIQESNITEVGERDLTQRIRASWQATDAALQGLLTAAAAERAKIYQTQLSVALQSTRVAIDAVLSLNQDAMVQKSVSAERLAEQRRTIMLAVLLASVAVGIYASTSLTRRILRPLSVLSLAANRLGSGDFAIRARVEGSDEIAELAKEFNTMATHLSEYKSSSLGELLQAQQSAQAAIDSLLDPVLVFSAEGKVTGFNQQAETVLKVRSTSGAPLQDLDTGLRELVERVVAHVLSGKGVYSPRGFDEAVVATSAEGDRFLLPRATPIYEQDGSVVGATLVLQDVTRLRRFDELKSDLVATVAHEFRTPLTSLRMAVHLCLEQLAGPITERQADLLDAAKNDCQRLQGLVDELLELSRIESGNAQVHLEATPPSVLAAAAVERHERLANERQVKLSSAVSPFLPQVMVDRERAPLVLDNLVVNAIRHSGAGTEVVIDARIEGKLLCVSVRDQGRGIAAEHREKIFDKFYRVPGSTSGGAGLGLYIARQIARTHGGDVFVESELGKGSTFHFTLPLASPSVRHLQGE
jgi:NtrC-family two-component system sensor histidine kinase KinB